MNKNEEKLEKNSSVNRIQEDVKKKEKLSLPFLICYIANFVFFLVGCGNWIFVTTHYNFFNSGSLVLFLLGLFFIYPTYIIICGVAFSAAFCTMVIAITLGIRNMKKVTNQALKKKINIMLWVVGIFYGSVILIYIVRYILRYLNLI